MNSRDIVRKAWQLTQVHLKKLIWYGATPAFFSIIVSSVYLAYQYEAFKSSPLLTEGRGPDVIDTVNTIWGIISLHPMATIIFVIFAVFVLLGYILLPPIFQGTLIEAIMRIKEYKSIDGSVEIGVRRFFPMFEFGLLTGAFSITTAMTESSFLLRWWGENIFYLTLPILLFIAGVGLLITFLFTYSEYYIVLENKRLIAAIGSSVVLVVSNLRKTLLIFILILLISARIILNVILILLIPLMVIVLTSYLATIFLTTFGIILMVIFGLAVTCVASYLLGLFRVFTTAVWVLTFSMIASKNKPESRDEDLGKDTLKMAPQPAPAPEQSAPGVS